jgi:uncharacterized protein (TIGR02646 family)
MEQVAADTKRQEGTLDPDAYWKLARQRRIIKHDVLSALQAMAGPRERCMYCSDSHGTDIEHFWPKTIYPEKMFLWKNLLLCCTPCNRNKVQLFPLADGEPLLVDPTTDDPWEFLDFDPETGNIVPRFSLEKNDWNHKGDQTVRILHLDHREALSAGYQKTYRRLISVIEAFLNQSDDEGQFINNLREADDHGLLGWFLRGQGQTDATIGRLKDRFPNVFVNCRTQLTT